MTETERLLEYALHVHEEIGKRLRHPGLMESLPFTPSKFLMMRSEAVELLRVISALGMIEHSNRHAKLPEQA